MREGTRGKGEGHARSQAETRKGERGRTIANCTKQADRKCGCSSPSSDSDSSPLSSLFIYLFIPFGTFGHWSLPPPPNPQFSHPFTHCHHGPFPPRPPPTSPSGAIEPPPFLLPFTHLEKPKCVPVSSFFLLSLFLFSLHYK